MKINIVPVAGPLQGFELLARGDVTLIGGRVWVSGRVSQDACHELAVAAELALKAELPGAAWMRERERERESWMCVCAVYRCALARIHTCTRTHAHLRAHVCTPILQIQLSCSM